MAETKPRVLFVCTHNAARSQMAEALLRHYAGERFEVLSAGVAPTEVHPLTRQALTDIGLDTRELHAKSLDLFFAKVSITYAIIVCDQAEDGCPRLYRSRSTRFIGRLMTPPRPKGPWRRACASFAGSETKFTNVCGPGLRSLRAVPMTRGEMQMIARRLSLVVLAVMVGVGVVSYGGSRTGTDLPPGTVQLRGAGSTFAAPLYKTWRDAYQKRHPQVVLRYEAIGSGEGTQQFLSRAVDFGASDAAMTDEEMAEVAQGVQLVPALAGSIVLAYNLEGLGGPLKLPRAVYVDIFSGKITSWDDPRIQQANPDLKLPRQAIVLAVRQDSSGTTYAFTNHLSAISDEWRDRGPGVGRLLQWPGTAMGARGNEGVAGRIQMSKGAIGYVEYGIARRAGLSMAWLENKAGQFIQPHGGSGLATLLNIQMPENFRAFAPDPDGEDSYPIVTYSWLLLYRRYDDPQKVAALKAYVTWCLMDGQEFSESLGFVRLPPRVATRAAHAVAGIQ